MKLCRMQQKITKPKWSGYAQDGLHFFQNRKTLLQMLKAVWKGKYTMSLLTHVIIVAGIFYIILPFDFDWIPVLGWLDDAFVAVLIGKRLMRETQRFNRWKVMDRRRR